MKSQIKRICAVSIKAGMKKLSRAVGYYELLGVDILIDENLKPYLLEINTNPALFCDTIAQSEIIPTVMHSVNPSFLLILLLAISLFTRIILIQPLTRALSRSYSSSYSYQCGATFIFASNRGLPPGDLPMART